MPEKLQLNAVLERDRPTEVFEAALYRGCEMQGRYLQMSERRRPFPRINRCESIATVAVREMQSLAAIRLLAKHGADIAEDDYFNPVRYHICGFIALRYHSETGPGSVDSSRHDVVQRFRPLIAAQEPSLVRALIELGCDPKLPITEKYDCINPDVSLFTLTAALKRCGPKCLVYLNALIQASQTCATPLHCQLYATLTPSIRHDLRPAPTAAIQCCAELLAAGADPCARTTCGYTPLDKMKLYNKPKMPLLQHAIEHCQGDSRKCLQLMFDRDTDGVLARRRLIHPRVRALLDHRRAVEAKRDARLLFQAASEGRPLELGKRLRLGKLAGGLDVRREVEDGAGATHVVTALEAARLGGHDECARVVSDALCLMGRGRL